MSCLTFKNWESAVCLEEIAQEEPLDVEQIIIAVSAQDFGRVGGEFYCVGFGIIENPKNLPTDL